MRFVIGSLVLFGILSGCATGPTGTKENPRILTFQDIEYGPEKNAEMFKIIKDAARNCWSGPNGKFSEFKVDKSRTRVNAQGFQEIVFVYRDNPQKDALTLKLFNGWFVMNGYGPEAKGPLGNHIQKVTRGRKLDLCQA